MTIMQPAVTDFLNSPDHSLSHRVFANDDAAPVKAVVVDKDGNIIIGDGGTSNYAKFDATGHQTMHGTSRPWKDISSDSVNLKSTGTGVSVNSTEGTTDFIDSANTSDYLYANIQLNHDRDETSVISPHIHWFSAQQSLVPNFEIWYRWQIVGGTKVTSWSKIKCSTVALPAPGAGVTKHQICETASDITPPEGSTVSDIIQFRIIRNTNNTGGLHTGSDPYSGTVAIIAFDVHYQINSIGSTDEYAK